MSFCGMMMARKFALSHLPLSGAEAIGYFRVLWHKPYAFL
jgi:hypothetical protein